MTPLLDPAVLRPRTLTDALLALQSHPRPTPIAGGTDIMPAIRAGKVAPPERWLALDGVAGLADTDLTDGALRIGAASTHARLADSALVAEHAHALHDVCARLGSPATRAWGTLGGTIARASRSMDAAAPLLVLDAELELASHSRGVRTVAVEHFSTLQRRRDLDEDELIVAIRLRADAVGSAFVKRAIRRSMDVATVGAAAAVFSRDGRTVDAVHVAVMGLWPTARRLRGLEERLVVAAPGEVRGLADQAIHAEPALDADDRVSDDYRRAVTVAALAEAVDLALRRSRHHETH